MKYNPEIHHRRSIRLPGFDYSQSGAYFVTICTYQKHPIFGNVKNGVMILNEWGLMVENEWNRISQRFPGFLVGHFIVMPNHHHGVLVNMTGNLMAQVGAGQETEIVSGNTFFAPPLRRRPCLGIVVGEFKAVTSRLINGLQRTSGAPVWQRNYYEHVIRDEEDYLRIAEYIINNPLNWEIDDLYVHQ